MEAALHFPVPETREDDVFGTVSTDRLPGDAGEAEVTLTDARALILRVSGDVLVEASDAWFVATGHDPASVGRLSVREFFDEADWDSFRRRQREVVEHSRVVTVDYRMVRSDGSTIEVFGRMMPWFQSGVARGTRLLLFDVTDRNRIRERASEADKLEKVGRLTAGIGHDFGNVFAVIKMNAEMLMTTLRTDGAELFEIEQVIGATDDGMAIVNGLMQFGRGPALSPLPLDPVLLVSLYEESIQRKLTSTMTLEILLEDGADEGLPILVDTRALEAMLVELVDNATDAMQGEGVVRLEVGAPQVAPDYGVTYTRISIRDDGVGIPDDARDRVFDPFYSKKRVGKGKGLGLAMLRRAMDAHEGHVLVESRVGEGTAFHLFFPCVLPEKETTRNGAHM